MISETMAMVLALGHKHTMALDQSALLEVLEALKAAWVDDRIRRAVGCVAAGGHAVGKVTTVAQAYAGHQFGVYVSQLGDGRALHGGWGEAGWFGYGGPSQEPLPV